MSFLFIKAEDCLALNLPFTIQQHSSFYKFTYKIILSPFLNPFPSYLSLLPYQTYPFPQYDTEFCLVKDDRPIILLSADNPMAIASYKECIILN